MSATVTLTASARYGYGGKQYIARITGRDSKFIFAREFVGQKGGKRRESSEYMTDEPGMYMTCDIDSKGRKDETFFVVYIGDDGKLKMSSTSKERAMKLAKMMDEGTTFKEARKATQPKKAIDPIRPADPTQDQANAAEATEIDMCALGM